MSVGTANSDGIHFNFYPNCVRVFIINISPKGTTPNRLSILLIKHANLLARINVPQDGSAVH